uniref:Reverse transcriptase domain-containing protein n=1 Tax=Tanacetum cinerariifolium TaxID=118510 RepID=A0A6L2MNQ6_TANCI|nr:hypothetical protein [Tanacetum cinerariifolium]
MLTSDTDTEPLKAHDLPDYTLGSDTESEPSEIDPKESEEEPSKEDPSKEDPIEDEDPLLAQTTLTPLIQPSPSRHALLVFPGQEIPVRTPYKRHPNGVRRTLTLRKMVHPPFTFPPVIEAAIAKEVVALSSERYKSSVLSSSPLPLPSCKRCRLPSPLAPAPAPAPAPPPPPLPSNMIPPYKRVRYQEGASSMFELGESSSAHIIPMTGEHIHHTIPLLVTRLVRHEAQIKRIKVHLEELPVKRVESIEQEIQTLQARAEAIEQHRCDQCKGPHYTKDFPLKEERKTLEESYYTKFGAPFQGGGYRVAAPGFYQRNIANPSYQERRKSMKETLSNFMSESEKRRASVSVMHLSTYLNLGLCELAHTKLTLELVDRTVKYLKGFAENIVVGIGKFFFHVDFVILDMPKDVKGRDEKIIFKSVKPASSLMKRVDMLGFRERMELDLEARLMGETLVLNRSIDPLNGDYIELNDQNEPIDLRRDQVDDLMPTIEECEVINAPMDDLFKSRNDELDTGIDDYPSCCDYDKNIRIDCA